MEQTFLPCRLPEGTTPNNVPEAQAFFLSGVHRLPSWKNSVRDGVEVPYWSPSVPDDINFWSTIFDDLSPCKLLLLRTLQ